MAILWVLEGPERETCFRSTLTNNLVTMPGVVPFLVLTFFVVLKQAQQLEMHAPAAPRCRTSSRQPIRPSSSSSGQRTHNPMSLPRHYHVTNQLTTASVSMAEKQFWHERT